MAQQVDQEELSWEEAGVQELQKLSIKHEEPQAQQAQEQAPSGTPNAVATAGPTPDQDARERPPVDPAIIEALQKGREADRKTITEIEGMVIKFIGDTSRDILEFPSTFGTYQKMLAHRVAQAYGLQTSTVDYEDGHGRVIGSRTRDTRLRKVRLTKMDLSAPEYQLQPQGDRSGAPKVLFRRPGAGLHDYRGASGGEYMKPSNSSQSMKEREEDYNRARERLGIGAPVEAQPNPGMHGGGGRGPNPTFQAGGRGGYGRGPIMQGRDTAGRGRGRKAVFRDRDRELQDPDYVRGFSRDGSQQSYEPGEYGSMEGAGYTEFGQTQSWGSGGQFRAPPPPPPPHPANPYPAQGPHKGGMPSSPAPMPGMAMYPAAAPGMPPTVGQPSMAAMPRPSYPAGMPMAAYPMAGYPGPMGYAAMPGQQAAMYAAQGLYPSQMGAAYGYMDASGGQDVAAMAASHAGGGYPMYAGYALYPQPHMAAMPGGMRAMPMPGMPPGPGMEHMYAGGYAYAMAPQGAVAHALSGEGKHPHQHQHQHGGRSHPGHSGAGGHNSHDAGTSGSGAGAGVSVSRQESSNSNSN